MRALLKGLGLLFLLWLSVHLWIIFSPLFLPGTPPDLRTFAQVESEMKGLAEARRAGPEAEAAFKKQLERSRTFDNSTVINYLVPLFLVWIVCAVAQARDISPLSIVGGFTSIWIGMILLFHGVEIALEVILPHFGTLTDLARENYEVLPEKALWQLGALAVAVLLVLLRYAPGFLYRLVFFVPRRLERALIDLLNDQSGWIATRFGARTARWGRSLAFLLLVGDAAWILWSACDTADSDGTPGTFGLAVRSIAVAFGLYLFVRGHLRKHGDLFHPRDLIPTPGPSGRELRASGATVTRRGRLRDDLPV